MAETPLKPLPPQPPALPRHAIAPPPSSDPFLGAAPEPVAPLVVVAPAAPTLTRSAAPFSIMPFDGTKKRRNFVIAIVSILTLVVGGFVTISIVSQMH